MSEPIEIFARNIQDLTVASNLGASVTVFDPVKVPVGNLPEGFTEVEALTILQIKQLAAYGVQDQVNASISELESKTEESLLNIDSKVDSNTNELLSLKANSEYADNLLGQQITTEAQRAEQQEQLLNEKIDAKITGTVKAVATKADLSTITTPADGNVAKVMNDPDPANNGEYRYDLATTSWVLGFSLEQSLKNWANSNLLFKPKIITTGMYTHIDQINQMGFYICTSHTLAGEIAGLPISGRAFHLLVSQTGNNISQTLVFFSENTMYVRVSNGSGTYLKNFDAFALTSQVNNLIAEAVKSLTYQAAGKNKYNKAEVVSGERLNSGGHISVVAGAKRSGFIPVVSGKTYTLSWTNTQADSGLVQIATFAKDQITEAPIQNLVGTAESTSLTFIAAKDVNFLVITLKHETATEKTNVQLEIGASKTEYEPYSLIGTKLRDNLIPDQDVKNYESYEKSKNLFNLGEVQEGKYLLSTGAGVNSNTGWACSGFIPVVEGNTYTLSGIKERVGLQFFSTATNSGVVSGGYNGSANLPLVVTAPIGAKFVVFNLKSPTQPNYSNIQFELGSIATKYMPYGVTNYFIKPEYILSDGSETGTTSENYLELNEGVGFVHTKATDLKLKLGVKVFNNLSTTGSAAFNFNNDSLNETLVRSNGDDIAPVRMMGATIGANHGYSKTNLTIPNHNRTDADIGSVWTDGTHQWVIVQILTATVIAVTHRTENRGYTSSLPQLTHVSGANNVAAMQPTAMSATQWYPMLKNHKVRLLQGSKDFQITTGKWSLDDQEVKVTERYALMEKNDITNWVIANAGSFKVPYDAEAAIQVSMSYIFDNNGSCVIPSNFLVYKDLSAAQDLMFTQSGRFNVTTGNPIKYYVPRSIAFTHESVNYDFSVPTVVDNLTIVGRIDFTASRTEAGAVLPDRLVMLTNQLGYAVGYLPVLDAAPEVRNNLTSKGIQISNSSAKVYPYLVDGLTTLTAGANYAAVAYRKYFKIKPERTCEYSIPSEYGDFLFLDWHSLNKVDVIDLEPYLVGRPFTVVEKTSNVTLLTKNQAGSGTITVKLGTGTVARLILKFSK